MGKKEQAAKPPAESKKPEPPAEEEPEEEEPQVVKDLKELDDKYLEIEKEFEKEVAALQKKFYERQLPLLKQRTEALQGDAGNAASGTPALNSFWLTAMKNHPHLQEIIESYDEPVLEYLKDITRTLLDDSNPNAGFKLHFHFAENPFFKNQELWKEFQLEDPDPYTQEVTVKEIKASTIDWEQGKNVTVEKTTKKVKGGGAKKAKQKGKEKEEARPSFFRSMFRDLKQGMTEIPEDPVLEDCDEDDDIEEMLEYIMDSDHDIAMSIRTQLIPYAVRWYTGEATPEGFDDEDEEEEEDDDDDDDDEDSDEDDEPAPKAKAKASAKKKGSSKGDNAANPDCKQQ
mmetsp:Transcript_2987/g.7640  ORF Transcript_2987/g.7640 Transcript_2987/m.7640 type:complete len:343 (+) Transcript_2987:62-1090(+)